MFGRVLNIPVIFIFSGQCYKNCINFLNLHFLILSHHTVCLLYVSAKTNWHNATLQKLINREPIIIQGSSIFKSFLSLPSRHLLVWSQQRKKNTVWNLLKVNHKDAIVDFYLVNAGWVMKVKEFNNQIKNI